MNRSAVLASVRRLRNQMAAHLGQEQSDEQLLVAYSERRDEAAFAALVQRHGPMVLAVCRRLLGHEQDAEDAFQATFLVLARRAAKLRDQAALAGFLHGTACHLASKIKRAAGRRRKYEGCAPTRPAADPADELSWREVRTFLDEEIAHLPEKYRSAFVLCCLEGVGREEAARRLSLKEGTLSSRLAEARKRLSQRLARRGVELTAVLAATAVATPPASAVPAVLMAATIQAALAPAGDGLAGVVSVSVAELVQDATTALMVSKAKIATVLVLAASLLTVATSGALVHWYGRSSEALAAAAEPPAPKADDKPKVAALPSEAAKRLEIHGRVLGPDGKPREGAKLLLLSQEGEIKQLGAAASDGRFTVAIPKGASRHWLIAQTHDAGMDFLHVDQLKLGTAVELRLVKDNAIRGRVVNTEGKPIRGVRVAVNIINVYPNNSLDFFLTAWKKRRFDMGMPGGEKDFWSETAVLLPAQTDADGRFTLHGIGAERTARLHLSGAGIADAALWIVNRSGFDPKPHNQLALDNIPKGRERFACRLLLHGPDAAVVVEPEKPIRGVVKDADSGKGQPGVVVYLTRKEESKLVDVRVQATTDAQGRYEMHGAHKTARYMLEVKSRASTGHMACQVWADDTGGYQPITVDVPIKKGALVSGKVIDGATGKPIPGFVTVDVLNGNPFAKNYPTFNQSGMVVPIEPTAEDGSFRLVTIPGPVLLMGGPDSRRLSPGQAARMHYKLPVPDPNYPQYFRMRPDHLLYLAFGGWQRPLQSGGYYRICKVKVLEIEPGTAEVKQDIVLERAGGLAVKIQDATGRPLRGAWAAGISAEDRHRVLRINEDTCSVYGLEAGKTQLLVFYEPDKKLVGTRRVKGEEKVPIVVKLGPAGSIEGRLLDADGKPLAGMAAGILYLDREAEEIHRIRHQAKQAVTDAKGAFTLDDLFPECKFILYSLHRGKPLVEKGSTMRKPIMHVVKPGERLNLGALKLAPMPEESAEKSAPPEQTKLQPAAATIPQASPKDKSQDVIVAGSVLGSDEKPVAGVRLYIPHLKDKPLRPLATSDAAGRFRFTVKPEQVQLRSRLLEPWREIRIVAVAEGYGPGIAAIGDPAQAEKLTLRLAKDDVPIKGRILDLQGKPIAGATIRVDGISVPNQGDLSAFLEDLKGRIDGYPAENRFLTRVYHEFFSRLFPSVTTGADGRFQLRGIGRERLAHVTFSGPTIETRQVAVRTRPGETIHKLGWAGNPRGDRFIYYGAEFDHAAAPTKPIVGVVRDRKTGKPLANAMIHSYKLAGNNVHGRDFLHTVADKDGRYRLVGMPKGKGNLIVAEPPAGSAYLGLTRSVEDTPGLDPVTVDFELRHGILIEGRVTDKKTGAAVEAWIEYFAFLDNPLREDLRDVYFNKWLATEADGSFRIVVPPGHGLLAARAQNDQYLVGVGTERIKRRDELFLPTDPPCNPLGHHRLLEINPATAQPLTCHFDVDPGRTLHGTVVGPDGKPLAGACMCGQRSYSFSRSWEGPLRTAEFTVYGLTPDRPRNLLVIHEESHLAGSLVVRGDEKGPVTIKLRPWGTITGRLVTAAGNPSVKGELSIGFGLRRNDTMAGSHPHPIISRDKTGRFRVEGLVPGLKYELWLRPGGRVGKEIYIVQTGETKDLGDMTVRPME